MEIQAFAASDIGRKREHNQDAYLINESLRLYIVCDGMGGHAAGEVASANATRLAADFVRDHRHEIEQSLKKPGGHFKVVQMAADCVRATCQMLHSMATDDPDCAGMGTTLTMLLIVGEKGILAHVGDSRLYLLRSGSLHQLTNDHTLANELIQTGRAAAGSLEAAQFSHVLTRALGQQQFVDVETLLFDIIPNDRFLICSDGLSNYFADTDEVVELLMGGDLRVITRNLIDVANSRGGNDNITCIVLKATHNQPHRFRQPQAVLAALESTFLCRGLTLNRRIRLANIGELKSFSAGELIIERGDERDGMYVLVEGHCELVRPGGRTARLSLGDTFGETGLAREEYFQIQVRAETAATVLFVSRRQFRGLVRRVPKLGRRLLDNLLNHISLQYDRLLDAIDQV